MDNDFRIKTLKEFEQFSTEEIQARRTLRLKCFRYAKTVRAMKYSVLVLDVILGATGITFVSSGVGLLPGLVLDSVG